MVIPPLWSTTALEAGLLSKLQPSGKFIAGKPAEGDLVTLGDRGNTHRRHSIHRPGPYTLPVIGRFPRRRPGLEEPPNPSSPSNLSL